MVRSKVAMIRYLNFRDFSCACNRNSIINILTYKRRFTLTKSCFTKNMIQIRPKKRLFRSIRQSGWNHCNEDVMKELFLLGRSWYILDKGKDGIERFIFGDFVRVDHELLDEAQVVQIDGILRIVGRSKQFTTFFVAFETGLPVLVNKNPHFSTYNQLIDQTSTYLVFDLLLGGTLLPIIFVSHCRETGRRVLSLWYVCIGCIYIESIYNI